jgi:hypothetical protein
MDLMTLHSPKELHKLVIVFWVFLFIQNINQLLIFLHVVGGHLEKKPIRLPLLQGKHLMFLARF